MDLSSGLIATARDYLVSVLPKSPFVGVWETWEAPQWLGWLNWVIPVDAIVRTLGVWVSVVLLYYLYSIVLRWIKMIG